MQSSPILVIGSSGKTGRRIVQRLTATGHAVRLGSRSAPIPFDWDRPEGWPAVLKGIKAMYVSYFPDLAVPGATAQIQALAEAAKAAAVEKIVLMSGRGEHHAMESEEIIRRCGLDFTLVRCAWFMQNFSEGVLQEPVMEGVLPLPAGDVREPMIDAEDIADVAVAALTEPGHSGKLYELTGPRLMGFAEAAADLSAAMGHAVEYVPISFENFHASIAKAAGADMADVVTGIARETLDGRNAHLTDGVQQALGRPARDFAEYCKRTAAEGHWKRVA